MNRKMIHPLLLTCALVPAVAMAFGNQTTWTRGWGQGVSEFVIKGKGKSQPYLACEDDGTQPATVIFTDTTGHQASMDSDKTLQVRIDDSDPIDISESDSRGGDNNLAQAWNALRTGKQVQVTGNGVLPALFTLKGAGNVLPEFGTHGCVSKASL
ncbi:hypothetical protein [Kosakonia sp. MH5]|uniref:hypothetical protein n=1 Tax=Kosakonia sp. MH5 TaxID=2202822 RepID=UPI0013752EA4|nr:hypothetical protein [Kosakonia sp. MH5]NCF08696.1 hypothetical protein [Kosakonia sp. MH5]